MHYLESKMLANSPTIIGDKIKYGDPNEVDGTQGSWSIQEGDEYLFVINRNTGEKYEIMLNKVE